MLFLKMNVSFYFVKILVDLCDDVYVAPLVTGSTNKRNDMTTIKTIIIVSPTCEVSMYFVFVTRKYILF